jgi:hypothetical protein
MMDRFKALRDKFKEGDWVFGLGEEKGCSPVFDHDRPNIQPFSYLDATNPDDFRLATKEEIAESTFKNMS